MSFELVISQQGGPIRRQRFDQLEIMIGRVEGNDLVLASAQVSKRHARIVLKDGKFIVVDLKSSNGTYVNSRRISSPQIFKSADKIHIGDFSLILAPEVSATAAAVAEPIDEGPVFDRGHQRRPKARRGFAGAPSAIAIDIERAGQLVERRQFSGFAVVTIGRGADNNIVLDDSAIAPCHAALQTSPDGLHLIDRSGGRGLWVDGEVTAGGCELYPGARIAIGPFVLTVR